MQELPRARCDGIKHNRKQPKGIFVIFRHTLFTARCYAQRGDAMTSRPSVRPSVRLSVYPSICNGTTVIT